MKSAKIKSSEVGMNSSIGVMYSDFVYGKQIPSGLEVKVYMLVFVAKTLPVTLTVTGCENLIAEIETTY